MTREKFWQLIEQSRTDTDSCEEQTEKLTALLRELEPEEIIDFQEQFDRCMDEADRMDLWAVAYIINGGCSDDGFVYFSGWLIGQGREYFEAALKDPERAADNADAEDPEVNECEALLYCAMNVYEEKTGQFEIPRKSKAPVDSAPIANTCDLDWTEDDLPAMFPNLCKRFGVG